MKARTQQQQLHLLQSQVQTLRTMINLPSLLSPKTVHPIPKTMLILILQRPKVRITQNNLYFLWLQKLHFSLFSTPIPMFGVSSPPSLIRPANASRSHFFISSGKVLIFRRHIYVYTHTYKIVLLQSFNLCSM